MTNNIIHTRLPGIIDSHVKETTEDSKLQLGGLDHCSDGVARIVLVGSAHVIHRPGVYLK